MGVGDRRGAKLPLDGILVGDCIEKLAELPRASIDLVFADPPYNLQLANELYRPDNSRVDAVDDDWDKFASFAAYDAFTRAWLAACRRVLKPDGSLWVIGSYHNIFRVGTALQDLGFWVLNDVIWRKTNPMPNFRGRRFTNAHETLIWASHRTESALHLQLRSDEVTERRIADALGLAVPDLLGRRAAQAGLRTQDASRRKNPRRCSTASSLPRARRATWCSTRSSAPARQPWSPSGSGGASSASSGTRLYAKAAAARIEAAEPLDHASLKLAKNKRAEPRIPFGALVELGLILPGTALYDPAARHEARVRADGSIACAGAEGSIHKIGARVQGALACNGWTFWHYEADGRLKPIDALREAARQKLEPQA